MTVVITPNEIGLVRSGDEKRTHACQVAISKGGGLRRAGGSELSPDRDELYSSFGSQRVVGGADSRKGQMSDCVLKLYQALAD
ncbi:hypothetical protein [Desulfosediminicola sp.]|uniref:hypothetical protein n=1 Tax=Desulfosediminicola sp. TaxID=2886825 RepID=UPI003AF28191